jgi:hypothetical protein
VAAEQGAEISGNDSPQNPDAPAGFLDSCRVAKLSRRKPVGFFQRAPLVGFQGNLLSQHDVACDQVFIRHETQPRCRPGVIVELDDVRFIAVAYAIALAAVAADDLEIIVRVELRQLLLRKPFSQQLEAALLPCTGALIPLLKSSRQV